MGLLRTTLPLDPEELYGLRITDTMRHFVASGARRGLHPCRMGVYRAMSRALACPGRGPPPILAAMSTDARMTDLVTLPASTGANGTPRDVEYAALGAE